MSRKSWTRRVINEEVLSLAGVKRSLFHGVSWRKLCFSGHTMGGFVWSSSSSRSKIENQNYRSFAVTRFSILPKSLTFYRSRFFGNSLLISELNSTRFRVTPNKSSQWYTICCNAFCWRTWWGTIGRRKSRMQLSANITQWNDLTCI